MAIAAGTKTVLVGSYDSSPFKLGLGQQGIPGGAVFTGTNLVYAYRSGGTLQYITCTPPIGQDPWTNVSPATSTWKNCWKNTNTGIETVPGLSMPAVGVASVTNVGQDEFWKLGYEAVLNRIEAEAARICIGLGVPTACIVTAISEQLSFAEVSWPYSSAGNLSRPAL